MLKLKKLTHVEFKIYFRIKRFGLCLVVVHVSGSRFVAVNVTYILQVHRFKVESANWLSLHFNLHLHSSVRWWHYICPYSKLSILRLIHEDLAASFRFVRFSSVPQFQLSAN